MTTKRPRILMTTSTFPGRADDPSPRFVLDLARHIQRTGKLEVEVLAPHKPGALFSEQMDGLLVRRFPYAWPFSLQRISGDGMFSAVSNNPALWLLVPTFILSQLVCLVYLQWRYRYEAVVANWMLPQALIAAIAKWLIPSMVLVTISRGRGVALLSKHEGAHRVARLILRQSDRTVAVGERLQRALESLRRASTPEVRVLPTGVDLARFESARQHHLQRAAGPRRSLLFVGRLDAKKGCEFLISALALLRQQSPEYRLVIAGDGRSRGSLQRLSHSLGQESAIDFVGAKLPHEITALYHAADVVVVPSVDLSDDVEGVPNVLMEAMACCVPVVTTDAGAINDLARNEHNALVVPQRDSEALAQALARLSDEAGLAERLVSNAWEYISAERSFQAAGERYAEMILETVAKRQATIGALGNPAPNAMTDAQRRGAAKSASGPASIGRYFGYGLTALSLVYMIRVLLTFTFSKIVVTRGFDFLEVNLMLLAYYVARLFVNTYAWRNLLGNNSEGPIPFRLASRVYIKANLAKYLPGNIFHWVQRQMAAESLGISQTRMATASVLEIYLSISVLFVITTALFALGFHPNLPVGHDRLLSLGIGLVGTFGIFLLLRRNRFVQAVLGHWRTLHIGRFVLVMVVNALVATTLFYLLSLALSGTVFSLGTYLVVIGALNIAVLVGLVTPGAPGGIGVREGAIVFLLGPLLTYEVALTAALLVRLHILVGELLAFAAVTVHERRTRTAPS